MDILYKFYIKVVRTVLNTVARIKLDLKITYKVSVFFDKVLNKYDMLYNDEYKKIRENME